MSVTMTGGGHKIQNFMRTSLVSRPFRSCSSSVIRERAPPSSPPAPASSEAALLLTESSRLMAMARLSASSSVRESLKLRKSDFSSPKSEFPFQPLSREEEEEPPPEAVEEEEESPLRSMAVSAELPPLFEFREGGSVLMPRRRGLASTG